MSLKYEQYWALAKTRDFLRSFLDPKTRPKNVTEMKQRALRCLRHYPFLKDTGEPMFSSDEFKPVPYWSPDLHQIPTMQLTAGHPFSTNNESKKPRTEGKVNIMAKKMAKKKGAKKGSKKC